MDNLSGRKRAAARQLIDAAGAELRFLPPCSRDVNPIEMAFSKLKTLLRKAAERTVEGLRDAIGRLVDPVAPAEHPQRAPASWPQQAVNQNDRDAPTSRKAFPAWTRH